MSKKQIFNYIDKLSEERELAKEQEKLEFEKARSINKNELENLHGLLSFGHVYDRILFKVNHEFIGICNRCGDEVDRSINKCPTCGTEMVENRYLGEYIDQKYIIKKLKQIRKELFLSFKIRNIKKINKMIKLLESNEGTGYLQNNKCLKCKNNKIEIYYFVKSVVHKGMTYAGIFKRISICTNCYDIIEEDLRNYRF